MQPISCDTNDIADLLALGQVYVDKTAYLYRLLKDPNRKLNFISRPRRFGKTLMLSTLKAIFQGKKELFKGLAISHTDYNWEVHPVIHLNLGFCASADYEAFVASLPVEVERALSEAGCMYEKSLQPADNLAKAIDWLYENQGTVVILIDEYDDPMARVLDKTEVVDCVRGHLGTLFGKLKDRVAKLRFAMVTGVSRFTKLSIFSAFSNLNDISFNDDYAMMLGFTEQELTTYYSEYMVAHAAKMGLSLEAYRQELKRMYNGYRFWKEEGENVYNPVSINLNFANMSTRFESYWADTGRPSMLMNFMKRETILAIDPERVTGVSSGDFNVMDLSHIPLTGLLYQTGYLTIKEYNPWLGTFTLGIPNEEVREDFAQLMAALCANDTVHWAASIGVRLLLEEWDRFFAGLKSLYAGVAYGPKEKHVCEHSYGRCLAFLLQGQGITCQPEVVQANGRVDMVCTHHCGIYIFELKVDQPAAIAMTQIEQKNYVEPYVADSRPIWLIGLSFDSKTRHLVDYAKQKYR